ncbi:MAG: hypothetical protein U9R25_11475 [Chloroflexota bacterium]|nr:hypothetical protein [Chloroflexota bacterium]
MNKKLFFIPLLVILLVLAVTGPAMAQTGDSIDVELNVPSGQLTVGDPIELTLEVTHPAGYLVIMPEKTDVWGDFSIASRSMPVTVDNGDGTETTSQRIDARLFAPGDFSTPALPLTITDGAGNLIEASVAPASVTIASVLEEGDTALRDIKPLADLSLASVWPWLIAGIAVLAMGVGFFLWWRRRGIVAVDNWLPHEIAFEGLDHVEALRLPETGRFKEHYTLVSEIIRVYIERRYQVPMLERTTSEIRASLAGRRVPQDIAGELVDVLAESDLVKFSKFDPDVADARELLGKARLIVERTMPMDVPEESGGETVPQRSHQKQVVVA